MKFFTKRTFLLLVTFLMLGIVWNVSSAKADYEVSQFRMQININKDGSADVNQSVTYDFDDDYHGVYLTQDLKGTSGAKLEGITVSNNKGPKNKVAINNSGRNFTAKVESTKNQMKLKVYNAVSSDDQAKIMYHYRINGVVTNYKDTAEINWKVIGSGWNVPLADAQVTIQLPGTKVKKLQAWSHGEAAGYTTVDRTKGRVIMDIGDNPENSFVEAHMVFPTALTSDNKKVVDKNQLAAIQKQEYRLVKRENEAQARAKKTAFYVKVIASILSVIVVSGMLGWLKKHGYHRYNAPMPIEHSFDIPTVTPAEAEALLGKNQADTKGVSAELLMLVAEGKLKFTQIPYGKRGKETTEIKRNGEFNMSFIDHCIDEIGDGQRVTIKQINDYAKKDKKNKVAKWYKAWQAEVDASLHRFKDDYNISYRHGLLGLAITTPVLAIVVGILGRLGEATNLYWIVGLFLTILIEIWILVTWDNVSMYNEVGLQQYNQIKGFKQMMKDIAHFNTAEIGDLILWEQILPYATAFGLAEKVAKKLKTDFGPRLDENVSFYAYYYGIHGANLGLASSISSSISHSVSASSGGSSGGFSGGSSGGFGGGSGGGAF
jgi:uncharacterized membrane protein